MVVDRISSHGLRIFHGSFSMRIINDVIINSMVRNDVFHESLFSILSLFFKGC